MYLARFEVVLAGEGSEEEVMFKKRKKEETQTFKRWPNQTPPTTPLLRQEFTPAQA
jgi:hypothetical protein